jgi:zinc protease
MLTSTLFFAAYFASADPALQAASAFYDNVRIETLPNGLQVVLKPIPGAPTVTTMVAYRVGAGDEELDATGLSHYLEHLMFKGTERLKPGDIDRQTQRNGGRNNAWTSEDLTCYHFDFAADRWETAIDIEADRMRNLRIDDQHEFRQEKGAVIAELDRNEDSPFDREHKAILPLLFGKTGPYGHPVIGEKQHVRGATAEIIKGHYDRWYHPNNAVLVVAGGFDPDRAILVIRDRLGAIPAGKLPERKTSKDVKRTEPQRTEIKSMFDSPRIVVGFNTVALGHADETALGLAAVALSGGKSSRLYRTLVEDKRLASSVNAYHSPGRFPGWFGIDIDLLPGKTLTEVETVVIDEINRMAKEPMEDTEFQRVRRLALASEVFNKEGVHGLAENLATGVALRGFDGLKKSLSRLTAVTPADVQRVTQSYLMPSSRVVVTSIPQEKRVGSGSGKTSGLVRKRSIDASSGPGDDLVSTQKVVLPNGLTLLMLENHRLPIVSARAFVRGVRLMEQAEQAGLASLTGSLLDEGSTRMTGRQIAERIENVGGELAMNPAGGEFKVLAPDAALGLELLFECLIRPAFPDDAFERMREQSKAALEDAETQPDTKSLLLFNEQVYGSHPYGRPGLGRADTLNKLKPQDCREFHRMAFAPGRTILAIVGDFDPQQIRKEVERLTADWKGNTQPAVPFPPAVPTPPTIKEFRQTNVTRRDAAQLQVLLGHLGIRRTNPDYYKLLVMDYILGTGSGFTDRLSGNLRDRKGLAYSVSANITNSAGDEPGTFMASIGTFPDKLTEVKQGLLAEIERLRSERPTDREVEDVKQYLLGSLPFHLSTTDQIADQLVQLERFGLGFGYFAEFRKQVAAVTPADVQAVAQKHLDPTRMVLIAVGPIDEKGKALPAK